MQARMIAFFLLVGLLIPALLRAAQSDENPSQTGSIQLIIKNRDGSFTELTDAAWQIEPTAARDARSSLFTLTVYTAAGDMLADHVWIRDLPIDLEITTYTVAGTRSPAELYAGGRIDGFPVNLDGSLTVESLDAENGTFSGTFELRVSQFAASVTGTFADLPLIPIETCRTSGSNADGAFTLRVEGSTSIPDFELPPNTGGWIAHTRRTHIDGGSPYIDLTLQDTLEGEGLRLEFGHILLDDPGGLYDANPEAERSVTVSLTDRETFRTHLIDEGLLDLAFDPDAGTLSGEFDLLILAVNGAVEARITGSLRDLPMPTRFCLAQNYD